MAITWRTPDDMAEHLRAAAYALGLSQQDIITEAVRDWLDTKGNTPKVRQARAAAADRRAR